MPTYQYKCTECGEGLEVVQKFTDDALTVCPNCGGTLRKVFSSVGIVFKGSGFYRTDSRSSSSGVASSNGASGAGTSEGSAKSESSGKSESSSSGKSESSSSGKSDSSSSGTSSAAA